MSAPTLPAKITRPFTRIDGLPVAIGVAITLLLIKVAYKLETGYDLLVRSAIRTYAEQETIFRQRYVLAGDINGRRVYDTRVWNGQRWYRISNLGTVAAPGSSNHETGRSIDFYDNGPLPGCQTSFSAPRNLVLRRILARYGWTLTGLNFGEPWHGENLSVADPFLGMGKPMSIDSSDPGQSLDGSTTTLGDDEMPQHENAGVTKDQNLEKGKFWPIELQPKGVHEFAMSSPTEKETGTLVLDLTLSGGVEGKSICYIRALYEEKVNGKWIFRKRGRAVEIIGSGGESSAQYSINYALGKNYRARVEVAAHYDGVKVKAVEYTKNYWRS